MDKTNKSNSKASQNSRYQRIGVLWKKTTADNRGYLSGRLTMADEFGISKDYAISIWPSRNKVAGDNNPDYVMDMDTERVKTSPPKKTVEPTSNKVVDPENSEQTTKTGESLL